MGKFEDPRFSEGTSEVAKIMSESKAYSIIGGGETITSFANINLMDSVDYASTAERAFLEYIENNSLPCIDKIITKIKDRNMKSLEEIATYIVSDGKGILAADESTPTIGKDLQQ